MRVEELERIHQLFHHQRHGSVKRRRTGNGVDALLHGVPLYPLLWPDTSEAVRPHPAGLFTERQIEELQLEKGGLPDRGRVVLLALPFLGLGLLLSAWGCVVVTLGQGHGDAQTFVPKPLSEPSLPPPSSGTAVFAMNLRPHEGTKTGSYNNGNAPNTKKTSVFGPCVVVVVVVGVVGVVLLCCCCVAVVLLLLLLWFVVLLLCRCVVLLCRRLVVCDGVCWRVLAGVGLAIQPDIPLHRAETQGGLLVPAKGVDDAECRDREQVGEEITWEND